MPLYLPPPIFYHHPVTETDLHQSFESAYTQISHPRFLGMEAIGGEVPFYVFTYPAEHELAARADTVALSKRLGAAGHPVCDVDLFVLCYELLKEEVDMEDLYELEREGEREEFMETLQSLLDLSTTLIPAITQKLAACQPAAKVLFLRGVGQVFPFLRTHSVLHNLQAYVTDIPTVLFFPGTYTGTSLELFSRLKNDNYYRAFHLNDLRLH